MSPPRYQRRKEERPQEITAAAFAAFAENGYAATKVEDVARRAGVSKGLLYLYFKTKEELFKAVIEHCRPMIEQGELSLFVNLGDHADNWDWLAAELIAADWKMKPLHRLIVTSATYRPVLSRNFDGSLS